MVSGLMEYLFVDYFYSKLDIFAHSYEETFQFYCWKPFRQRKGSSSQLLHSTESGKGKARKIENLRTSQEVKNTFHHLEAKN